MGNSPGDGWRDTQEGDIGDAWWETQAHRGAGARLFDKRAELVVKADGARYVPVKEIAARARVPLVHRTTAARYLRKFGVVWRRMREKPPRTGAHEEDRKEVCRIWRRKPATYWTNHVDHHRCEEVPPPGQRCGR